jgi:hypothetical protein
MGMKGGTLFGIAAILAVLGYFGLQLYDRYRADASDLQTRQFEALSAQNGLLQMQVEALNKRASESKALMQEAGKRWESCLTENEKLKAAANP